MTRIFFPIALSSGVLGFYRGTQEYNYKYNKELQRYNKNVEDYKKYDITDIRPYFFYSASLMHGLWGTFFYVNPFLMPFFMIKEIYRLEVNMRNDLDELKKQDEYYKLF